VRKAGRVPPTKATHTRLLVQPSQTILRRIIPHMEDFTRRARQFSAGRTVLDGLAIVFLACSTCFWFVLHWAALVGVGLPGAHQLPQAVVAVAMTLIYAFALPLLLSMLVPTTPAGQLLQKTMWRTIGFPVVIVSTVVLGFYAQALIRAWFESQPEVVAGNLTPAYMVAALVGFIVIPALCWVQVTPERWIREVEQAHQVRKLELMQRGELAIVKSRLLWAEQKALIGYAKLLPAEQKEVIDTMRGLLMGIGDTQRTIARTMGIEGELERSIMGDAEIADSLDYVSQQLEKPARSIDRALTSIGDGEREKPNGLEFAPEPAHVNTRLQSSTARSTEPGQVRPSRTQPDDAGHVLDTIRDVLPRVFTAQDVAEHMRWQDKRPAQRVIRSWLDGGHAEEVRLGRYSLTE
jgi:hypothetical protein